MTKKSTNAQSNLIKQPKSASQLSATGQLVRQICSGNAKKWTLDAKSPVGALGSRFYVVTDWMDSFAALSLGSSTSSRSKYLPHSHGQTFQADADALASDFRKVIVNSYATAKKSGLLQ